MNCWLALVILLAQADSQTDARNLEVTLSASVSPDTVTIGDPFYLAIRVEGLGGASVEFPIIPDTGAVAALEPPVVRGDQPSARTAVYTMTAWRVGELRVPDAELILLRDGVENRMPLPGASVYVRSVLPADADPDTLTYQPARGVVGPNWSLAEKLAGGALALALLLAVALYLRRRNRATRQIGAPPPRPPRERALEALDRLAQSGLIESGEYKAFYSKLAQILREFIALERPGWGVDLTSGELLAATRAANLDHIQLEALRQLLNEADLVKFARRSTPRGRAGQDLEATRRWVRDFRPPPPPPAPAPLVESAPASDGAGADGEDGDAAAVREIESVFEAEDEAAAGVPGAEDGAGEGREGEGEEETETEQGRSEP